MGQDISVADYPVLDSEETLDYINGKIVDFHIENQSSQWKLKANVLEKRASVYKRTRSATGAPVVGRNGSIHMNFGTELLGDDNDFPLPSTEEEIKAFDQEYFVESTRTVEVDLRQRQGRARSRSVPDLSSLKNKLLKLQAPSKPKFLDRLFSNVSFSRKTGRRSKNGLVIHSKTPLDKTDEGEEIDDDDLTNLSDKPDDPGGTKPAASFTSDSSDSGKGSILEYTSDFSPTGFYPLESIPGSPQLSGIVKQRLQDFQKLKESQVQQQQQASVPSESFYRTRTVVRSGGKLLLFPGYADHSRLTCCAYSRDEKFSSLVMKKGFVKAVVEQINHNDDGKQNTPSFDKKVTSVKSLREKFESCGNNSNFSKSCDDGFRHKNRQTHNRTPQGSPRLRRDKNVTSLDAPDSSARNSLRSSEFGGQSDTTSNGHDRIEGESGIASDCSTVGFSSVNVVELFDSSWSDSDMSFDEYSDWDSDVENAEEEQELEKVCELSTEDKLHRIALELYHTEKAYVNRLYLLDQIFQNRVREENPKNFLPADVINQMFSNITSIYQFHNKFLLPQLEDRMENWSREPRIGDLMRTNAPFLKLYTEYVKNFDNAMNLINLWAEKCSKFAAIMQDIQKRPECGSLTLQHHMLEPVQRVPRYQLLLQDYLRKLPEDSPDKQDVEVALELVTKAASHSNEAMKKIEKFHKLLEINEKFGAAVDLISPTRELVREGRITKISARGGERLERYIFLFNDLMLICCDAMLGSFKIKAQLDMEGLEILDSGDKCVKWILEGENIDIPNTFYVKSRQKIIQFLDENHNGDILGWCESMKEVIKDFRYRRQSLRGQSKDHDNLRDSGLPDIELGRLAPKWIKDDEVTMCMHCTASFTAFRRRHHCRSCGIVVCSKCSSKKVALAYDNYRFNRVCDKCYSLLKTGEEEEPTTPKKKNVLQKKASDPSVYSGYLQTSTDKGKTWNKRWFVVHGNYVLYSYKAHQDVCALFALPLPGYTVAEIEQENMDKEKCFKLFHRDQDQIVHYFQGDKPSTREKWVNVLTRLVKLELPEEENKRSSTQSSSSSSGGQAEQL